MKAVVRFFALLSFVGLSPAQNVRCELLIVRVSQADGLHLRKVLREPESVTAGVGQLQKLISTGKAELVGAPVAWGISGGRGVAEAIEEIRYSTAFDPPSPPQNFFNPPIQHLTPWTPPPVTYSPISVPFAFETRNVGVTLVFEAFVAPGGRTIELNIVPQNVTSGEATHLFSPTGRSDWRYRQPAFRTAKLTTGLTLYSGEWRLVNVAILREPPRMEFHLIRATALPVPK